MTEKEKVVPSPEPISKTPEQQEYEAILEKVK